MSNKEIRHEYKIVVIGAGGTGGALASMLARYLYSKKTDEIRQFKLYLIDGDLVDKKILIVSRFRLMMLAASRLTA